MPFYPQTWNVQPPEGVMMAEKKITITGYYEDDGSGLGPHSWPEAMLELGIYDADATIEDDDRE